MGKMIDVNAQSLSVVLRRLQCLAVTSKLELLPKVTGQLLWHIQCYVEDKFTSKTTTRTEAGTIRKVSRVASDISDSVGIAMPMHHPDNHRQTIRETGRYQDGVKRAVADTQHLYFEGPAMSNIGTVFRFA